jgi:hypothetical protein
MLTVETVREAVRKLYSIKPRPVTRPCYGCGEPIGWLPWTDVCGEIVHVNPKCIEKALNRIRSKQDEQAGSD